MFDFVSLEAFDELCQDMRRERCNCRGYHTFKDETFMGILKTLAGACAPSNLEHRILSRFYLSMFCGVSVESPDSDDSAEESE